MDLGSSIISALAPGLNQQLDDAKTTAQQVAGAMAGWALVLTVELGIVIWLLARKKV